VSAPELQISTDSRARHAGTAIRFKSTAQPDIAGDTSVFGRERQVWDHGACGMSFDFGIGEMPAPGIETAPHLRTPHPDLAAHVEAMTHRQVVFDIHVWRFDLDGRAAVEVKSRNRQRREIHSLRNRAVAEHDRKTNANITQIKRAGDACSEYSHAVGVNQRDGLVINRKPSYEPGTDVAIVRPILRVRGVIARIQGLRTVCQRSQIERESNCPCRRTRAASALRG
jgi:hypothetical protein